MQTWENFFKDTFAQNVIFHIKREKKNYLLVGFIFI